MKIEKDRKMSRGKQSLGVTAFALATVLTCGGFVGAGSAFGTTEQNSSAMVVQSVAGDMEQKPEAPIIENQTIDAGEMITGKSVPGAEISVQWFAVDGDEYGYDSVSADDSGNFAITGQSVEGQYDYNINAIVDGNYSRTITIRVTVEGVDVEAPAPRDHNVEVAPKEIVSKDFVKKDGGVNVLVDGYNEDEKVTLKVINSPESVEGLTVAEIADENGEATFNVRGNNEEGHADYIGDYEISIEGNDDGDSDTAVTDSFRVVAEEDNNGGEETPAPRDHNVEVTPKKIVSEDFVKEDGGVTVSVDGYNEDERVVLAVIPGGEIGDLKLAEEANESGEVEFHIRGDDTDDPNDYVGEYDFTVEGKEDGDSDEPVTGSFEIVASDVKPDEKPATDEKKDSPKKDNEKKPAKSEKPAAKDDSKKVSKPSERKPVDGAEKKSDDRTEKAVPRDSSDRVSNDPVRAAHDGSPDRDMDALPYTGAELVYLWAGMILVAVGAVIAFVSGRGRKTNDS